MIIIILIIILILNRIITIINIMHIIMFIIISISIMIMISIIIRRTSNDRDHKPPATKRQRKPLFQAEKHRKILPALAFNQFSLGLSAAKLAGDI